MLCDNCEKVVLKSIQRKYYKTVMNIEMGQEVKSTKAKDEKQISLEIKQNNNYNNNNNNEKKFIKEKDQQSKEKKLMIFD